MKFFTSFWRRQFDEMSTVQEKTYAICEEALQCSKEQQKLIEKLLDDKDEWMKERELNIRRRETLIAESKK